MIRSVKLDCLPAGVHFPDELSAKVSYDTATRRLQFDGFMSKTDFDKLVRLSNDLSYQRALEELFQICTYCSSASSAAPRRWPWIVAGVAIGAVLLAAVFRLMG